jgi:hypothetical protein
VLNSIRTVVFVVVLLCWSLSGGVAVADSPNLENVTDQFKDTPDGWRLHVSLYNVTITSVPNMAATAFTREAYVSATAEVWVEALHPDDSTPSGSEVTQRSISLWLQQGCQTNLSVTTLSENATAGSSLSGTAAGGGAPSISPSGTGNTNPSIQQTLQPGNVTAKNLQNKAYPDLKVVPPQPLIPPWVGPGWSNDKLTVSVRNWNLAVDSCAGPVSFRFIAEATMSTRRSDDAVDAFSAIVQV